MADESDYYFGDDLESSKKMRCQGFKIGEHVPRCYSHNTTKEESVLEHVLEYERHFKICYDTSRLLLLAPKNECEIRKFICTTLRPTKLPYTELYEWKDCAEFISNFLEYEELSPPDKLPEYIPSPCNIIEWQAGDSFDFSILLCSLLIGSGYDAYCVYGAAPKYITTKDESLMDCPFDLGMNEAADEEDKEERKIERPNKLKEAEPLISKFDRATEQDEESKLREQWIKENTIDDDAPDLEKYDELENNKKRLHCWVMIRQGLRQFPQTKFIEPTTGREYSQANAPYQTVEGVFNHQNFWINLTPQKKIKDLNLQCDDDEWEYVMLQAKKDDANIAQMYADDKDDDGDKDIMEDVLDMPPPWSPKLYLDKDKFLNLCPLGEKTVFYKKCRVDTYAPCTQVDGLVKKVCIYDDYKRLILLESRSYYENRRDKLRLRRQFPYEFKLVEYYDSSEATNYWKKMVYVDGHQRQLYFYHHRNNDKNKDGLIYREENIGSKTIEKYKDREDHLEYRSVTFEPISNEKKDSSILQVNDIHHKCGKIKSMVQKFGLDPDLPAEDQIRETEFNIESEVVQIYKHYREGKITAGEKPYDRKKLIGNSGGVEDLNNKETEDNAYKQELKKIHEMEMDCHRQINIQEESALAEMEARLTKEKEIKSSKSGADPEVIFKDILEKSYYDKARDKMKQGRKKEEENTGEDEKKDFLYPVLEKLMYTEVGELTHEQAMEVKNEALKRLKERLLTRAEIIQRRLEDETNKLQKAFQELKKKGDSTTDEDELAYEKKVTEANFKIEILTERASHHYQNSLTKFNELDTKLLNDSRLKALRTGND
ncbi:unnamed protein product [Moneuplotes crassus]|uniref:Coiled-coil domain-containing protein lobo homolog n=1 Tax=Euplotes crassus TaxID=5936 RepID=A0AAD1UDH7_EUPCR|nr:unnamed protein product [Moneuplotes crassus]